MYPIRFTVLSQRACQSHPPTRVLRHSFVLPLPATYPPTDPSSVRLSLLPRDINNSYSYGITFFMGVRALLYPPFLLKTKIQVARGGASEKSAFQVARATVREEGVRGLYKVKFCTSPTKNNSFSLTIFPFAVFLTLSVFALLLSRGMVQSAAGLIAVLKYHTHEELMPPNLPSEGARCRRSTLLDSRVAFTPNTHPVYDVVSRMHRGVLLYHTTKGAGKTHHTRPACVWHRKANNRAEFLVSLHTCP